MDKEFNMNFIEEITINSNFYDKLLLYRFYDEYKKINNTEVKLKKELYKPSNLLLITSSFDNIKNKILNLKTSNYDLYDDVTAKFTVLNNYIYDFDINDRIVMAKIVKLITYLECVLKLPLTFPNMFDEVLKTEIKRIVSENKEYNQGKGMSK